jgi:hypothetical protein
MSNLWTRGDMYRFLSNPLLVELWIEFGNRGTRKGSENGRCPLYREEEDAICTYIIKMFGNEEVEGTVFE